ncbi:Mobile element protein [Methanosarcina barkeri str. Wiesmoor]|uniref:Mobile element protein n=1 Tax=Methanosarcina barkeri str. Wiesmoor TaxID=1434109 RepID=A0A0E3QKW8_METBA|nr:Mobile element protein [Methanosarcina barkeri str. Wiesmoor]
MLKYYKGQDKVEKGFRFLKSDTFSVSKMYLKNKSRIEALTMIMVEGFIESMVTYNSYIIFSKYYKFF